MKNKQKLRVLFISANNSMHSQIAEALLRYKSAEYFDIYSADIHPTKIDNDLLQAIVGLGLNTTKLSSWSLTELSRQQFDYVITLSEEITKSDISRFHCQQQLVWNITTSQDKANLSTFITLFDELNSRISMLLMSKKEAMNTSTTDTKIQIDPISFYKCLTDDIRLKTLILTHYYGELCVCDLMSALQEESQPKVSRNLAVLKKAQILKTRKQGQWVFYRINEQLPLWVKSVIAKTAENNTQQIINPLQQLSKIKKGTNNPTTC
ncbi:metalloregulator ArsR/SmtB family transcription factor [Psychromonas sp. RZ22]|nr:metalloregulator ArsR/SmtB family transcription factor [Psychromonas sp. RZ22]